MAYALVTGASKGIGEAIAEELARRNYDILLVARSEDLLEVLAKRLSQTYYVKTDYLKIDISNPKSAQQIYQWCIDQNYNIAILVNNAGYGLSGGFENYTLKQNLEMMQVNMSAPVELCQLFLPMLYQQPKAYILNVASTAAYQPVPGLSLYAASKAFILNFSRGLRQELYRSNISVSCVCPGPTDTDFSNRANVNAKGLKAAAMVNMSPKTVARTAINGLFSKRAEVIPGLVNKVTVFFSWLLPKSFLERIAGRIYQQ